MNMVVRMLVEVEGFILQETPYGETSKIIQLFTNEYGVIGVMCKGAKSLKSKFRVATLKYTYAKYTIYYKENKLSILSDADIIHPLTKIRCDIALISFITYLSDLTYQVVKQSSEKSIYQDFVDTILKIENGLDPVVLTNILELKYLHHLGVLFHLDACVCCGNKTDIVTISSDTGGFVCKDCLTNERIVDAKVIKVLRMYYYVQIKSISALKIEDDVKNSINLFLDDYYERYTGLYLNSKRFLKNLSDFS